MMEETEDMFAYAARRALARRDNPDTSHAAADSLTEETLSRLQMIAYSAIKAAPNGLTAHDLARVTNIEHETIGPRLRPLANADLIHDSGERRVPVGRTRTGIVWKIGPKP